MRYERWANDNLSVIRTSGDEFVCRCIFHDDHSPSLYVNVRKGLFFCQACQASGRIERLAKELEVELIDTGVPTSTLRNRLKSTRVNYEESRGKDEFGVLPETELARFDFEHPYWHERGLSDGTIKDFGLGYDRKRNLLTIPVRDRHGHLRFIIRRRLDDAKPKYLYPKGFAVGRVLFGIWKFSGPTAVLVEGPLDAVKCHQANIMALAMLGARLSKDQMNVLTYERVRRIVVMTDNDRAGRQAAITLGRTLTTMRVNVVDWSSTDAKDPGELSDDDIRHLVQSAVPFRLWWKALDKSLPGVHELM